MANVDSSRQTRRRPEGGRRSPKPASDAANQEALSDIRRRLEVAMAVTTCISASLAAQHADTDADAALALQRCVADELDRQIERLDSLLVSKRGSQEIT